jgi:lipopolysaccharide biosynthesis glycosyltransferase
MNHACVCFTTDMGYMFPSLLSAVQARERLDPAHGDVIIVLVSEAGVDELFFEICRQKGIILIIAPPEMLRGHNSMYARLFLDEMLPAQYSRILYIDGDVQIVAPLDGLIALPLAPGALAAAADPMCIEAERDSPQARRFNAYFASLGVKNSPATPYFNSGVLLVERDTWAKISGVALKFIDETPELCLFQDQSALNFAGHANLVPLSFRWNFPAFFRNADVETVIRPVIYHFMSKPKPWNGNFPPWNSSFSKPYQRLISEYPGLAAYSRPMSNKLRLKYFAQQNYKRLHETKSWRFSTRRDGILRYFGAAKF